MPTKQACEELNRVKLEAIAAFHSARNTRRARDLSFQEDVELTRDEHRKIDELLKHLLSGHDGHPCPAGDRPIIGMAPPSHPNGIASKKAAPALHPNALLQGRD